MAYGDSANNDPRNEYLKSLLKYKKMDWNNKLEAANYGPGVEWDNMEKEMKMDLNDINMKLEAQKMKDLGKSFNGGISGARLGQPPQQYAEASRGYVDPRSNPNYERIVRESQSQGMAQPAVASPPPQGFGDMVGEMAKAFLKKSFPGYYGDAQGNNPKLNGY